MKTFIRRFIYFLYYLKKLEYSKFKLQLKKARQESGRSYVNLIKDVILSSFKYNISPLEYFYFRFHNNTTDSYRSSYAGTGFMYEMHTLFNPQSSRYIIHVKDTFLKEYARFIKRDYTTLKELASDEQLQNRIMNNKAGKVVIKNSDGQCGEGVEVISTVGITAKELIHRMKETNNDLVEEYVIQHDDLMELSPSGLNTIRIVTQFHNNIVEIIGATLRITVNNTVDNMAAGNMAAPVDITTGIVSGPGVYSDICKDDMTIHPLTGKSIVGFQIPYWEEVKELTKKAALHNTSNRSIGWDIAITNAGPDIIEANHAWCKLVWQLPHKKGLKPILIKYKNLLEQGSPKFN